MAHILDAYWSAEDSVFVATVPDLPGCMAHGDSQKDALANVRDAIQLWMDTAREFGDPVPELRDFHREPHD